MIKRYEDPEIETIWGDEMKIRLMTLIENSFIASALGRQPYQINITTEFINRIKTLEKKTHHDVVAFMYASLEILDKEDPEAAKFFHAGLTSSDIVDTTFMIQMQQTMIRIQNHARYLELALEKLIRRVAHIPTWGRTHGQYGEVIQYDVRFSGWLAELKRCQRRLARAAKLTRYGKLAGPMGNHSLVTRALEYKALYALGMTPLMNCTQVIPRDIYADIFHSMVMLACCLERMALNIRLLQQSGIDEMVESFGSEQVGSSSMPHKKNPVKCEKICGLARLIRSHESAVLENCALWLERDITHSSVERVVFPDTAHALIHMLATMQDAVLRSVILESNARQAIDKNIRMVSTQQKMLNLVSAGVSREKAHKMARR